MPRQGKPSGPEKRDPKTGHLQGREREVDWHERDEELAQSIETLSGLGMTAQQIGQYHGLTRATIEAHYSDELASGEVKANVKVGAALFQTAIDRGHRSHVQAAIWWTKARMGWADPSNERANGDAGPRSPVAGSPEDETPAEAFEELMERMRGKG